MILNKLSLFILLLLCTEVFSVGDPVFNRTGQVGLKESLSARTLGRTHLAFSLNIDFSSDGDQIDRVFEQKVFSIEYDTIFPSLTLFTFKPVVAFGVTDFFDLAAGIPVYFDVIDQFSPEGGFGDLEFSSKLRIPLKEENMFQAALYTSLSLPTGNQNAGFTPRYSWYLKKNNDSSSPVSHELIGNYTAGTPESSLLALISLCLKKVYLHVNSGVRLTFNPDVDNLFILNGGLEIVPSPKVTLFIDAGATSQFLNISNGFQINQDHFVCSPGITLRSTGGALFTLSCDINLSSNHIKMYYDMDDMPRRILSKNEPVLKFSLQTGWNRFLRERDRDGDQVPDDVDKCPYAKEDIDGFEDADGCEDTDNDKDGIVDLNDKCRDVAEDADGIDDSDGCPDFDNDKDNIADSLDKCTEPEDVDGFEDLDGCPDVDNDKDNVRDSQDKCPMIPEDLDGFQDDDGCPDLDNDMDGVMDSVDQCRDLAGSVEQNGCQTVRQSPKEIKFGRVILQNVDFGSGSTVLSEGSFVVLDQVVASLNAEPGIVLEIRAHTDNSGNEQDNIRLCQKRADIICDYLASKGVQRGRLISVGRGGTDPIAGNETVEGRKINTRIEIHRKN